MAEFNLLQKTYFETMHMHHLDEVLQIERAVQCVPWTRQQFIDSLAQHRCQLLFQHNQLLAYSITLQVLDEMQLLNLAVTQKQQRKGLGKHILMELIDYAHQLSCTSLLVEVRASEAFKLSKAFDQPRSAFIFYQKMGFKLISQRKNYYYHPLLKKYWDAYVMRRSI